MGELSELISKLTPAKGIKGPSPKQLKPNNKEAYLFKLLADWHKASEEYPYILGVPKQYQK